ncbi:hypothetical protein [Paractinoplanes toevensis]|uniref:Integral membrane protein n=1 Tax=Paractinoplanes toevensis TaxID=571911 RepID=A0A919W963_9ACTN|nr:hypothetical protein [Actinoplanes toevensis]GIM95928.1 hypothetical protein Ato02nite_077210 [Actinoplanes toevensis]
MTHTEEPFTDVRPQEPDHDEVARLRAELATLQGRLEDRRRREFALLSLRRVAAAVFITIAAFALVAGVTGLWAATTVLNTDRWVATVAPLPKDPQVSAAVAQYATTEVFEVLDVQQRIESVLPQQAGFVAGPITGQLREAVDRTVTNVLRSDRFQAIWTELNRRAHQRILTIVEGRSEVITAAADHVDIDLLPLINQVLRELSAQLPTLFGKQITLPDLSSGAIPDNLRARVQDALGVTLPANFAQFTIYDSGQLWALQESVATAKRSLALFVTATVVLLALALIISPARRRTILQLGLWLVVAAVAVTVVLRGVRDQVLAGVPEGVYRDGVAAAMTSVFSLLRLRGQQLLWIGVVLAVVAYLCGPGRGAVWLRHQVRRGAAGAAHGASRAGTHAPGWIAAHADVLRVGGLVAAAIAVLLLSSWTSLFVVVVLLAAYEVGVTLVARGRSLPPHDAPTAPTAAG